MKIMIQRLLTLLLLIGISTFTLSAQDKKIGYGFRAGLSYSKFNGPSEIGPNGEELESFTNDKGFHIGVSFAYKMTDLFGFRTEFMFSQRGTNHDYDGPSYYLLGRDVPSSDILITGTRHQTLNVNNSYIDIPLMVYQKIGKFEIFGGLNTGLLITSTAGGSINFEGISGGNQVKPYPFLLSLDYNYKSDKAGEASVERTPIDVSGLPYAEPSTLGAYYEFEARDKMQYQTLDFSLMGGASFYFNQGLYLSWRYLYGLGDVDRNDYDISLQTAQLVNSQVYTHVKRADKNSSLSMQFSVGFSF